MAIDNLFDPALDKISRLADEIVLGIVNKLGVKILKPSLISMDGTEYSGLVFEIDRALFYAELRAALRAKGFELPDRR